MCKAFSLLVTKSEKTYWKMGIDSHDELHSLYVKKDKELIDDKDAPNNTFARIEIVPKNNNYIKPDKWVYQIDERVKPNWIGKKHKEIAFKELEKWKKDLYSKIAIDRMPPHPFKIKAPIILPKHIKLVKEWASVRDSVGASVWDSVRDSVWDSVGDSVWDSVRDSVRDSVWDSVGDSVWDSVGDSVGASVWDSVWASVRDSVWASVRDSVGAQTGYMFPKIKKWKYCDNVKVKGYPFKSVVKLWRMGLVTVRYGNKWHLYGSPKGDGKIECLWTEQG
jgi:hypothetical protein